MIHASGFWLSIWAELESRENTVIVVGIAVNNRVVDLGNLFSELSRFMKGAQPMFFKFFFVFLGDSTTPFFRRSHQLPHCLVCISWRGGLSEHPQYCLFQQIWRFFKEFCFCFQSVTVINGKLLVFFDKEHTFFRICNELLLYGLT